MLRVFAAVFAFALVACQGAAPERFSSSDDGFSVHALGDDWTMHRDKGAVVFRGPADSAQARTTIAIRPVRADERATATDIVDATADVLAALPAADVHGRYRTDHKRFDATAFHVTFTPKSKGVSYERRHVVLTNDTRRVYHVMLTAPAGELQRSESLFADIVGSLKGEG